MRARGPNKVPGSTGSRRADAGGSPATRTTSYFVGNCDVQHDVQVRQPQPQIERDPRASLPRHRPQDETTDAFSRARTGRFWWASVRSEKDKISASCQLALVFGRDTEKHLPDNARAKSEMQGGCDGEAGARLSVSAEDCLVCSLPRNCRHDRCARRTRSSPALLALAAPPAMRGSPAVGDDKHRGRRK